MSAAIDPEFGTERVTAALNAEDVRIDFGTTLSLSQGVLHTARIWTHGDTARRHAFPLLVGQKDGTRADLIRLLAGLAEARP